MASSPIEAARALHVALEQDVGPFTAGQELVAHIAQFVSTRDGRVAAIETYDCYEPF